MNILCGFQVLVFVDLANLIHFHYLIRNSCFLIHIFICESEALGLIHAVRGIVRARDRDYCKFFGDFRSGRSYEILTQLIALDRLVHIKGSSIDLVFLELDRDAIRRGFGKAAKGGQLALEPESVEDIAF